MEMNTHERIGSLNRIRSEPQDGHFPAGMLGLAALFIVSRPIVGRSLAINGGGVAYGAGWIATGPLRGAPNYLIIPPDLHGS